MRQSRQKKKPSRNNTKPSSEDEYYRNRKGQFKKQGMMYRLRKG